MPIGRPSLYRDEFPAQARKLCLLGATNVDLARFFGVGDRTLQEWIAEKPAFAQALKEGKEEADANVAKRLYSRAMGYRHKAVKIFGDPKTGDQLVVDYVEQYPPDTTACIFWLKNRRPDLWRDRHELKHEGKVAVEAITNDDEHARQVAEEFIRGLQQSA